MDKSKKHLEVKSKGGALAPPLDKKAKPYLDRVWIRNLLDSLWPEYESRISLSKDGQQAIQQVKDNHGGHLFDFLCSLPVQWECNIALKSGFRRYDDLFHYHLRMMADGAIYSRHEATGRDIPTFYSSRMYESMSDCLLNMAIHITGWCAAADRMKFNYECAKAAVLAHNAKLTGKSERMIEHEVLHRMNHRVQAGILGMDEDEFYHYEFLKTNYEETIPF